MVFRYKYESSTLRASKQTESDFPKRRGTEVLSISPAWSVRQTTEGLISRQPALRQENLKSKPTRFIITLAKQKLKCVYVRLNKDIENLSGV